MQSDTGDSTTSSGTHYHPGLENIGVLTWLDENLGVEDVVGCHGLKFSYQVKWIILECWWVSDGESLGRMNPADVIFSAVFRSVQLPQGDTTKIDIHPPEAVQCQGTLRCHYGNLSFYIDTVQTSDGRPGHKYDSFSLMASVYDRPSFQRKRFD